MRCGSSLRYRPSPTQKVIAQVLKILGALPQGGHRDGNHIEPVVEVLPEGALRHFFLQIRVGQGQKTDVQLDGPGTADAGDLLGLDGPQQLHLQVHGHIPDLIQHQGAVVGVLEQAHLALGVGAGKGPLLIAEQLGLQQVARDGGAVDLHIGLVPTQAAAVDLVGHHLFAHPRLAGDEHRGVSGRDPVQQGIDLLQRAVFSHHTARQVLVRILGDGSGVDGVDLFDKGLEILLQGTEAHNGPAAGHYLAQRSVRLENGRSHHIAHQGLPGFIGSRQAEGALFVLQHAGHRPTGKELVLPDQGMNIPV